MLYFYIKSVAVSHIVTQSILACKKKFENFLRWTMAGFRLQICRTDRGYTQKNVADALGVSRSAYAQYETGARDIPTELLVALADFYGCTTDELLGSSYYYANVADAQN